MSKQFVHDTNNTNRTTRTDVVTGRWYLSGEPEQVHSALIVKPNAPKLGAFFLTEQRDFSCLYKTTKPESLLERPSKSAN
jgi:hypothetical protein